MSPGRSIRALLVLLAIAALFAVLAAVFAPSAAALGKIKCDSPGGRELPRGADVAVFTGPVDPIVNHNGEGAPHEHDFFGASGWQDQAGNAANHADLTASPTSCRLVADTAGYWTPVLRYTSGPRAGERVPVLQFTAYYRGFAGQTTHPGTQALPADARLVAQDMVGYGLSGWTCGQKSTVNGGRDAIPDCSASDGRPGDLLTAHINYPSCWNGQPPNHTADEVGDTRDNADFVYPSSKTACPVSHPVEVTQLRQTIQYAYFGAGADGSDVALDSDHGALPGTSMHGDFWNTWDQAGFEDFVARCVQTSAERDCNR